MLDRLPTTPFLEHIIRPVVHRGGKWRTKQSNELHSGGRARAGAPSAAFSSVALSLATQAALTGPDGRGEELVCPGRQSDMSTG